MNHPNPLRAITLHPWWAYAITHGDKRIEYRTRPLPPRLVDVPIALHAGAATPADRRGTSERVLAAEDPEHRLRRGAWMDVHRRRSSPLSCSAAQSLLTCCRCAGAAPGSSAGRSAACPASPCPGRPLASRVLDLH